MVQVEARFDDARAVVLTVTGELDLATVERFCQCALDAIARADGRPVVIDAAAVTFVDSTGLSGLVTLNNAATTAGTSLILRTVPRQMASMLRLTALDTVIPISDGAEADL